MGWINLLLKGKKVAGAIKSVKPQVKYTGTKSLIDKYKKTVNLSKALQKTKLEMMNNDETSHPFFWAPFILIGNISK